MPERENPPASPRLSIDSEGIARLVFDAQGRSANVLTEQVMDRLVGALSEIKTAYESNDIQGVLISSGKPSSFIVGADIDAIAGIDDPNAGAEAARTGQAIYLELERLPVPTVVAIHGPCVGGGTELALACRYRLASDAPETRIGLPEVQLGILPAWGGTTRLPRLIGLRHALDLLLTGKPVSGRRAKGLGLVDDVFPHDLFLELAETFLRDRVRDGRLSARTRRGVGTRLLEDTAPGRRVLITMARRRVLQQTGGHYPAPLRILDVLRSSMGRPLDRALEAEALAAGELIASRISKNLVHIFKLREGARKGAGAETAVPTEIHQIAVVGAGTMGGGIAQLAAFHGIQVRIKDVRQDAVSLALKHAAELFDSSVRRRRLSRQEADQAMDLISGGLDYVGLGPAGLVVEAVVEKMEVKRTVLGELESRMAESSVIATNTSSLSVDALAEALTSPGRFLGMHFFNPVHKMPLIEIVRGKQTEDSAVATIYHLAVRMGKVPVVVRDGPGFLVNRILGPYLNEAGHLLGEGATIDAIDGAAVSFGMPMGPLRLIDEVGIDIVRHAGETLHKAFGERLAPAPALVAIADSGRLGKKGGSGFYKYENGRESGADPTVYDISRSGDVSPELRPTPDAIRDRLVLSMINEGARVLSDGITSSAGDLDLAMIMGTGFPPFRGGLLRFADEIHPRALVQRLEHCEGTLGERFSPAPLLRQLARDDRGFYEAFPGRTHLLPPASPPDGSLRPTADPR